jgi:hypothetical protein
VAPVQENQIGIEVLVSIIKNICPKLNLKYYA